jgi:hypothetical protein
MVSIFAHVHHITITNIISVQHHYGLCTRYLSLDHHLESGHAKDGKDLVVCYHESRKSPTCAQDVYAT